MSTAVTSKTHRHMRNWKKICFLACMCAVATLFLSVPGRKGDTIVQFLAGVVWGLAGGGIFSEFFNGPGQ